MNTTELSRKQGKLPDRYWYQFNNQSPLQNYLEQKEKIYESLQEEDTTALKITSEVNFKK